MKSKRDIIIFTDKDLPRDILIVWDKGVRVEKTPWPPIISIHPPSIDFWQEWPIDRGIRAINCLLIGVEKAIDVRNSFILGSVIKPEVKLEGMEISVPIDAPTTSANIAWSFKNKGRVLSLAGRIINHVREPPTISVAWERLNIGIITSRLKERWKSERGAVFRGAQEVFIINRIVYIEVNEVAKVNNIIKRYEMGSDTIVSIIKSLE